MILFPPNVPGIAPNGAHTIANSPTVNLASDQTVPVICKPTTSGGCSVYKNLTINATGVSIKGSAGQVYGWYLYNNASATRYVKLYDSASAPTVGTTVPYITIGIPSLSAANVFSEIGIPFSAGIGIGGTTGVADANTGAPTANDIVGNIFYA